MAHAHDHHDSGHYVEELCSIAICGAIGGVAIMLWARNVLMLMLDVKFHLWVLLGGIALLVMVAVRAVTVWLTVGRESAHAHDPHHHDHDHEHGDCCHEHEHAHAASAQPHQHEPVMVHSHEHAHGITTQATTAGHHPHHHDHSHGHAHDHDHGPGHEHGWSPWRFAVLLLPVVLYFLGLPNRGFSELRGGNIDLAALEGNSQPVADKGTDYNVTFLELERASFNPDGRYEYEGKTVRIKGLFRPLSGSARKFTLIRYKMNCCAADAIPLNMVIESPVEIDTRALQGQWVEVIGKATFSKKRDREEYVPVLIMKTKDDMQQVEPDLNPYL